MTLITPPRRALLQGGFAATSLAVVSHAWAENAKQGEQAEDLLVGAQGLEPWTR
jgi:hypothetical protein